MIRVIRRWLLYVCLVILLVACSARPANLPLSTPPPTPAEEVLQVSGTSTTGPRLRVTLPLIKMNNRPPEQKVQLFLVLGDAQGTYSYMLYPANDAGFAVDQFNLTDYPLEISLNDNTSAVTLWILAVHNTRYYAAEMFGLDALVASLGLGFRNWLADGDPADDPLAAVVSASNGDVLGQAVIIFEAANGWDVGLDSRPSPDGGLNAVYSVHYVSPDDVAVLPSPTPVALRPGYQLLVDETFPGGTSTQRWYQDQDHTYVNHIVDGAYEIRLTDLSQRESGMSWGSIEGAQFKDYILEADVNLLGDNLTGAQYGIWFHYQDDYNFIYFGLSSQGESRVAVVKDNSALRTIQDWTSDPAIHPGAATNTLTVEAWSDGMIKLSANGEQLLSFTDTTYASGSVAFFCRSTVVPTTCHLTRLQIWQADAD
jgi:hypothetical protein